MNKPRKKTEDEFIEQVRHSKTARGFVFVLGLFFICLTIILYFNPNPARQLWIDLLLLIIGIVLVLCAKYASGSFILRVEQLFTGWP